MQHCIEHRMMERSGGTTVEEKGSISIYGV